MTTEIVTTVFDYSELDAETRIVVQQEDKEFDRNIEDANTSFIHACKNLQRIHEALKYKRPGFEAYCQSKSLPTRTAYRMISVAEMSDNLAEIPAHQFGRSALYLLAAPSTPEDARREAVERAQAGEEITHGKVREIVNNRNLSAYRRTWELQNDIWAWLLQRPAESRLEIVLAWKDQRAAAPFWVDMVRALPQPWRHQDLAQAIDNLLDTLRADEGDRARGLPPIVPGLAGAESAAGFTPVWRLEQSVRTWLDQQKDDDHIRVLEKMKGGDGWPAFASLQQYVNGQNQSRRAGINGLHEAIDNVLNQLRQRAVRLKSGESLAVVVTPTRTPEPVVMVEADPELENSIRSAIYAGIRPGATIQHAFSYRNHYYIATSAKYPPDGRNEYECWRLVPPTAYMGKPGGYEGQPLMYQGERYLLSGLYIFTCSTSEVDVDPWELLAVKLAALDDAGRTDLTELFTSTAASLRELNPAAAEFVAAVLALLMAAAPAEVEEEVSV